VSTVSARQPNGPAAAAILAAGIGCFVFGLLTIVEHTLVPGRRTLTLYPPVGSHSGTTAVAVVIWIIAWCLLHGRWKTVHLAFSRIFVASLALIALGCLGTFPPTYQAVGAVMATAFGVQLP
jgi:heme/copper-type cytochrome/quinol oxidase subunit 1